METRNIAKVITMVVIVRQTAAPSRKQQDLQQKVCCKMERAQSPSKLPTQLCEVEDYYNIDSSTPSSKQVFQSKTEAVSSKIIIMLIMTIGTSNLEE